METGDDLTDNTQNSYAKVVQTVIEEAGFIAASAMQVSTSMGKVKEVSCINPKNEEGKPDSDV